MDVIAIPPFVTPQKPPKNADCNGCGWCCHMSVCAIGEHFYPEAKAPCPAIIYEEGRVKCGIVIAERAALGTDEFGKMLGIGKGCCSDDWYDRKETP